jgi:hypothetical protein
MIRPAPIVMCALVGMMPGHAAINSPMVTLGRSTCRADAPSDATNLRRRGVSGVKNASDIAVRIRCTRPDIATHQVSGRARERAFISLEFDNATGSVVTVRCKFAVNAGSSSGEVYTWHEIRLAPSRNGTMRFTPAAGAYRPLTFSADCALPPHATVRRFRVDQFESAMTAS